MSSSLQPITLYAHKGPGPNPYKVAFLLEALGLPYEPIGMEFGDDADKGVKSEKFLKVNPNGRVPAIIDPNNHGLTVWESGAIMYYICEKYDTEGRFFGKTVEEKTETMVWLTHQLSGLGPAQGQVNWFKLYHAKATGEEPTASITKRYRDESERLYAVLEQRLGQGEWLANGRMTIADLAFHSWLRIAGFGGLSLDAFPKLKAYTERMEQSEPVKKALAKMPQ